MLAARKSGDAPETAIFLGSLKIAQKNGRNGGLGRKKWRSAKGGDHRCQGVIDRLLADLAAANGAELLRLGAGWLAGCGQAETHPALGLVIAAAGACDAGDRDRQIGL